MTANTASTQKTRTQSLGDGWRRLRPYLRDFLVHAVGQVRVLKKTYPGIMHFLLFWGVTIQVVGTLINLLQMQLFLPFVELTVFPRGAAYLGYELVMDLAGVMILLGVGMALFRRLVLRPATLPTRGDDIYALVLLGLIPLAGFTLEGLRLVAAAPLWANWSPVGSLVAGLFRALGMTSAGAAQVHTFFFWTHVLLGLTLVASIPFTKLRHLVMTPLNILVRPGRKSGVLDFIPDIEEAELLGVGEPAEFKTGQLLSLDACLNCGRCENLCPVALSGMDYSPRQFIQNLRQAAFSNLVASSNGGSNGSANGHVDLFSPEAVPWYCTTCGVCLSQCPAFVNPVDQVVDLRRYHALTTGKIPRQVADVFRNLERQGNPWGMSPQDRMKWADGLDVRELAPGDSTDVLLFVGCAFAFDQRNVKVVRDFVKILQAAGVDFGVLGFDESCCGETARRMGHEYIFQMFAEQNIEMFSQIKFNRIVTQCPHCFNTLKNEYPQMGGDFPVQHYTAYLADIGWLPEVGANGNGTEQAKVAYHDPCYLGRYNQEFEAPRILLDDLTDLRVELPRSRMESFCCGGGGGQMWLETDADKRINLRRLDEVLQSGVDTVATACPYCLLMFDDAIRSRGAGDNIQVLDIAELMAARIPQKMEVES